VLAGWGIGAVAFGAASIIVCFRVIANAPSQARADERPGRPAA
jgi:hypothetical protein